MFARVPIAIALATAAVAARTTSLPAAVSTPTAHARPTTAPIVKLGPSPVSTTAPLVVREPPPKTGRPPAPPKTRPTPRRTPTPTPPARPFVYRYMPPLSAEEALSLIRACSDILRIKDETTLPARCRKVCEIIRVTNTYLTQLDQRHSTLASYKWHFIDREKVGTPGIDVDTFTARPPIPNVSAISFAADYGDVYIYTVSVYNDKGKPTTFTINSLVQQNYPHEEICYLVFPTTVERIVIKYEARRYRSRTPRVTILAGVAREQEYLKQTITYLRYASREAEMAVRDRARSQRHIAAACENLRRAASRLIRFQMKQKY